MTKPDDRITDLIRRYKKHLNKHGLEYELYKWKLLKKYRNKLEPAAEDFAAQIKEIDFSNLIYHSAKTVIQSLADREPEAYKKCFENLVDEKIPLPDRISQFESDISSLYRKTEPNANLSHHHDERTVATLLTFYDPEKYTFYKNTFYQKYCKVLGIKSRKPGEKYVHFLELTDDLIDRYIRIDPELQQLFKNELKEDCFQDENFKILAQDIIFQTLDGNAKISPKYWILPVDPNHFDEHSTSQEDAVLHLPVSTPEEEINTGDQILLWRTGEDAGCYAIAKAVDDQNVDKQNIKLAITHNLSNKPILRDEFLRDERLSQIIPDEKESLLSCTKDEYILVMNLIHEENDFEITISKFPEESLDTFIHAVRSINKELDIKKGDQRVTYSIRSNRLNYIVGQRYCLNLMANDSRGTYGIISNTRLSENAVIFQGLAPQPFYNYCKEFAFTQDQWASVVEAIQETLTKTQKSGYLKYNNTDFEDYVFKVDIEEDYIGFLKEDAAKKYWLYSPGENAHKWDEFYAKGIVGLGWDEIGDLNQYESRDELEEAFIKIYGRETSGANSILANEEFKNSISIGDVIIVKKGRNELLGYGVITSDYFYDDERENFQKCRKVDWKKRGSWELDFHLVLKTLTDITEYDTEDPRYDKYYQRLLGIMNDDPKDLNSNITKHPLNTIFYGPPGTGKTYHTIQRAAEITENRKFDSHAEAVEIYKNKLHDQIEMITFHQNYSYEDFIQGLRPDTETNGQLSFEKKDGVFKVIADRAMKNLKEAETDPHISPRKNYVIIIDEINRANISRVFGELITLIEPDKRSHGKIPMKVKLPSGDTFMVPSNLYIIGTMNTADKSIALLDIALRRRFEFEAMYPRYKIPGHKIYDAGILRSINEEIIRTKGHDFQIGHSYFMDENKDLAERMNKKVIPLLLEYYMNDEKEVRNILNIAGLEIKDDAWPIQIKGKKE